MSLTTALRSSHRYRAKVTLPAAPSSPIVNAATIRAHVRQALTDDDTLLGDLELAAQAWVEAYLGRALLTQTRVASYDGEPGRVVLLPEPVTSLTSVKTYDDADAETTVVTTTYALDAAAQPPRLVLRDGQLWPSSLRDHNSLVVTYVAGWANAAAVPKAIVQALLLLVAHWYQYPAPLAPGSVSEVPYGIEALLMPYRLRTGLA